MMNQCHHYNSGVFSKKVQMLMWMDSLRVYEGIIPIA